MVEHRIHLIELDTTTIHLKPYQAGPKTREYDIAEVDEMLTENIIEPAQVD